MLSGRRIAAAGVVLEEISMRDDDPGDLVHDEFTAALFGDVPLGRPILGTEESIRALTRRQISGYYRRRYTPDTMVVSVAGNIDHAEIVRLTRRAFAYWDSAAKKWRVTPGLYRILVGSSSRDIRLHGFLRKP